MRKSLLYLCCLSAVLAQDQKIQDNMLDSITTSDTSMDGTSWKSEDVKNNAGSRTILSNMQLTKTAQGTIDSALQTIPGIQVRDYSGAGILPKLEFRGFGGAGNGHSNTGLILLDGNNVYGGPYSNIELALFPVNFMMVDHIDYIKGGASVQYGPNTFGGVLNVISKPISENWESIIAERITFWDNDTGVFHSQNGNFASNALYDTYLKTGGMINEHFGIDLQADVIGGQSFRENTPTEVQNYMVRGIYKINPNHIFNAFYQYYNYYAKDAGALSPTQYHQNRFQNLRPNQLNSGTAQRTGLTYNWFFGSGENFDGNFSFNYYFHNVLRNFRIDDQYNQVEAQAGTTITDNIRKFIVHTVEPKVNFNITSGSIKQNIIIGGRFVYEGVQQATFRNAMRNPTGKDKTYKNQYYAFYISDEIKLWDTLTINPGLRYEFLDTGLVGVSSKSTSNQFNPAVSISYKPIKDIIIYANYSRSFLPPQTGDITGLDFPYITGFQNAEGGVRYFISSNFSINANYFAIFADNYRIGRFATDNGISAISQGAEIELYASPVNGLNIHASYTFTDARVSNHKINPSSQQDIYGKLLPYVSPHSFNFDISYDIPKFATIGISGFYYSKSYSDILNTKAETADGKAGELPDYFVFNAQISRTLWKQGKQKIDASIAVNNIFNANYYFRGIGTSPAGRQSAPGRSVVFFVSYAF